MSARSSSVPIVIASLLASAASPTRLAAEATFTTADAFNAEALRAYGLRMQAEHILLGERLTLQATLSVVRATLEEEGETDADNAVSNPSLLARYGVPRGAFELGVTTGIIAAIDDDIDPAKLIVASFESPRRPYELALTTAVPLIVDARYRAGAWAAGFEAGAYIISDGGPQLDDIHLALRGSRTEGSVIFEGGLHALFVPAATTIPVYAEMARRAYFGVELAARLVVDSQRIGIAVWKPFGYDNPDATVSATSLGVTSELRF